MSNLQNKTIEELNIRQIDKEESIRLWNRFNAQNRPMKLREQLIKRYAYLTKWVIGRFPDLGTADFDREDLLGQATVGLIEAIDRYNPQVDCSFESFAIARVRGEILDFLRSRDHLSRSSRSKVKRFREAYDKLEQNLGREPSEREIQVSLNITAEDLQKIKREANSLTFSLDASDSSNPSDATTLESKIASDEKSHEESMDNKILKEKLAKSIDKLTERERLVVALYHYQKLTFKEIGTVLDLSESRTSQIHSRALIRLRSSMKEFESLL